MIFYYYFKNQGPLGQYKVLDTNYDSWAAVWACESVSSVSFEYAWILSREMTISQSDLNRAIGTFSQYGIDVSQFQITPQGLDRCIYCPEYPYVPDPSPECANVTSKHYKH